MKKSKLISLVLISATLASCHKKKPEWGSNVYMRSDSTAGYDRVGSYSPHNPWLWYYAFRPYGTYYGGSYHHAGYYSEAISEGANVGHSSFKSGVVRGGFGGGYSVSS
jgi:hypothetical protein